jgi:hypothetical protein
MPVCPARGLGKPLLQKLDSHGRGTVLTPESVKVTVFKLPVTVGGRRGRHGSECQ